MAQEKPQLIVVAGPDESHTAIIGGGGLTIGRAATCGLPLSEPTISREHLRLALAEEGVTLEVLSHQGVEIDGRMHKRGQLIVLGAGDVLTLGLQTQLLFVDRGGDADVAMVQWRVRNKAAAPETPEPVKTGKAAAPVQPTHAVKAHAAAAPPAGTDHPVTAPVPTGLARRRKLLIGLGIYGAAMVALIVVLALAPDKPAGRAVRPKVLTQGEIEKILKADLPPSQNADKAVESLDAARRQYQMGRANIASRYNCIRQYKLYKAYSGRAAFEDPADQARYDESLAELVKELVPVYTDACNFAAQERWHQALAGFQKARDLVDDQANPFNINVLRHIDYTKKQLEAQRKGKRQFLGD